MESLQALTPNLQISGAHSEMPRPNELKTRWQSILTAWVPSELIDEYAAALASQYISVKFAATHLTEAHMCELKIRIAHRREIALAAAAAINDIPSLGASQLMDHPPYSPPADQPPTEAFHGDASMLMMMLPPPNTSSSEAFESNHKSSTNNILTKKPNTTTEVSSPKQTAAFDPRMVADELETSMTVGDNDDLVSMSRMPLKRGSSMKYSPSFTGPGSPPLLKRARSLARFEPDLLTHFKHDTYRNSKNVTWHAVCGSEKSYEAFLDAMSGIRKQCGFPESFDRSFLDNNPMPFNITHGSSIALLLRIPDNHADNSHGSGSSGSSVSSLTNRFVLMFSRTTIVTYHRCANDLMDKITNHWASSSDSCTVLDVVDKILKRVTDSFAYGVELLQDEYDEAEDMKDRFAMVEKLTNIQKCAHVFSRCLKTGAVEIKELAKVRNFGPRAEALGDQFDSIASTTDEIAENALSTMNMQMALDGFRSSKNMKIFTLVAVFCQPITVATGWYGMNWVNFPELQHDNAYFIFAALALCFATMLAVYFFFLDLFT